MSILKEFWLLKKDWGAMAILFIMPLVLIITITLIQDNAFKSISNKIPILVINHDNGDISSKIVDLLHKNKSFELVEKIEGEPLTENTLKENVFNGNYNLGVVFPAGLSKELNTKIEYNVQKVIDKFSMNETSVKQPIYSKKEIKIYFDPALQQNFKNNVQNAVEKMIAEIENKSIYKAFQNQLGEENETLFDQTNSISFKEISPIVNQKELKPNSVQHNVPAWSLFAIFFIIVPLSINIVKEKNQGTFVRLLTNPVPYSTILLGKTCMYLIIAIIQFILMLMVGYFFFPYIGLSQFEIGSNLFHLLIVALFSGLAAIGFGLLLGTIAKTQEQSAPFGATSVVLLAAIGGVWVPVFAMPKIMQYISNLSPMNWGLNAFYDIILRNKGIKAILPELSFLLLFYIITTIIAVYYEKKKREI